MVLQDVTADPTLPRTRDVTCAKCAHNEAVFFSAATEEVRIHMVSMIWLAAPQCKAQSGCRAELPRLRALVWRTLSQCASIVISESIN